MKNYLQINSFVFALVLCSSFVSAQWSCGDTLIDVRDGRGYGTVQIGNQCWTAENMNIGTMINSNSAGGQMSDDGIIEKYCWQNNINNCDGTGGMPKYGGYYEWEEALQFYSGQPQLPVQGVCPESWHVPTKDEFDEMISFLGGGSDAATAMQPEGVSGFDALLTGYRCTMSGGFLNSPTGGSKITYYWTAEQSNAANAYFYEVRQNYSFFGNGLYSPFLKSIGTSIRCLKDDGTTGFIEGLQKDNSSFAIKSAAIDQQRFKVWYSSNKPTDVILNVFSFNGKLITKVNKRLEKGSGYLIIQIPNIPSELVFLYMTNGEEYSTYKTLRINN